jgi:hypothetical protein
MNLSNVRIVSDGFADTTKITADGVELRGVTKAVWEISGENGRVALLKLEIEGVPVDVVGECEVSQ